MDFQPMNGQSHLVPTWTWRLEILMKLITMETLLTIITSSITSLILISRKIEWGRF